MTYFLSRLRSSPLHFYILSDSLHTLTKRPPFFIVPLIHIDSIIMLNNGSESCSKVDVLEAVDEFHNEVTSFNLPSFLLGNFADARPAVFSC